MGCHLNKMQAITQISILDKIWRKILGLFFLLTIYKFTLQIINSITNLYKNKKINCNHGSIEYLALSFFPSRCAHRTNLMFHF